jgi:carbamoyl-phosphate synthase small subunit
MPSMPSALRPRRLPTAKPYAGAPARSSTREAVSQLPGGYLLLEDGTRFDGDVAGAPLTATGEVVFNTAMSGYQEAVTDPSYRGQIIVFTYPLIGNYGISREHQESDAVQTRAVVMREGVDREDAASAEGGWLTWLADRGVPALTGVDTRALVRHIRDKGAMRGGVFAGKVAEREARERVMAEPPMAGADLACEVTPPEPVVLDPRSAEPLTLGAAAELEARLGSAAPGPLVVGIDTGIKDSIVRNLRRRGVRLELHPCTTSAEELLARSPDAVFLANGPGDPAALDHVVESVRGVVGKVPVFGICMGHQLLCRAIGLDTFKLPFGHRGANHPVKDLQTGKIDITSQNHGFAVRGPGGETRVEEDEPVRWDTDFGVAELSHVNLYDRTVEGLLLRDVRGATAQYHPEAGPGPHDALYLFDRYLEMVAA